VCSSKHEVDEEKGQLQSQSVRGEETAAGVLTLDQPRDSGAGSGEERKRISSTGSLEVLGTVLAPGTLIGALLYYFGWIRTNSFYAYFGIDLGGLGLSTTDYFLRSADALWPPFLVLVLLVLLSLLGHLALRRRIDIAKQVTRRWLVVVLPLYLFSSLLLAVGVLQTLLPQWQGTLIAPLSLTGGFAGLAYARYLHRQITYRTRLSRTVVLPAQGADLVVSVLFVVLVILSAFWATTLFADELGRGRAQHLESVHFSTRPDILLYSSHRLHIDARDVVETDLGLSYAPYQFRYEGLKLLIHGDNKMVLIPYSWSTTNAFAIVLPERDDIRVVFAPNF